MIEPKIAPTKPGQRCPGKEREAALAGLATKALQAVGKAPALDPDRGAAGTTRLHPAGIVEDGEHRWCRLAAAGRSWYACCSIESPPHTIVIGSELYHRPLEEPHRATLASKPCQTVNATRPTANGDDGVAGCWSSDGSGRLPRARLRPAAWAWPCRTVGPISGNPRQERAGWIDAGDAEARASESRPRSLLVAAARARPTANEDEMKSPCRIGPARLHRAARDRGDGSIAIRLATRVQQR